MATSKVFKCCLVIFLLQLPDFGKAQAEVRLSRDHIRHEPDNTECENDRDNKKSPADGFRLTKLLDIRFDDKYENLHPDLIEAIRSEAKVGSTGSHHQIASKENLEKYFDVHLSNMTSQLKEMSEVLNEIKCEVSEIKENISIGDDSYLSKKVQKPEQYLNTLVGVDIKPYCQCSNEFNIEQQNISKRHIPKNCKEIQDKGNTVSGIYEIQPKSSAKPFKVLCDMEIKGGGWTHIQRRIDGSQDFYLGWREYKFGFGDLTGEFWIGLENIYLMTGFEGHELLVEIVDRDQVKAYAHYKAFAIGPEVAGYPLKVLSGFSGDAGDSLAGHLGSKFTTKDFDQDANAGNCAQMFSGAWWYASCHVSNLNGKFLNVDLPVAYKYHGLHWAAFRNHEYCHAKARMLVRPAET